VSDARPTDSGGVEPTRPRRRPTAARKSKTAQGTTTRDRKKVAGAAAQTTKETGAQVTSETGARATTEAAAQAAVAGAAKAAAGAAQAAETARAGVQEARRKAAEETLPREVAVERGRRPLVGLAIGGAVGFGVIFTIVRLKASGAFDVKVTRALQSIRLPGFDLLMRAVSWPGFPPQSRAIPPVASGAMAVLGYPLEAAFQILAWGTGLVSTLAKALMKRPRPTEPEVRVVVAPLGGSSFPSGHVITYMGVYGFLAYLAHTLIRPARLRRALVGFFGGLVALVGPSRVYQGHHWPTDVIASYLLGLSYLIGVTTLYRRLKGRLAPRLSEPAGSVRAERDRLAAGEETARSSRP
jgi:membrane-associated phospholipid phosphatase